MHMRIKLLVQALALVFFMGVHHGSIAADQNPQHDAWHRPLDWETVEKLKLQKPDGPSAALLAEQLIYSSSSYTYTKFEPDHFYRKETILKWNKPLRVLLQDGSGDDIGLDTTPGKEIAAYFNRLTRDIGIPIIITRREMRDNNVSIVLGELIPAGCPNQGVSEDANSKRIDPATTQIGAILGVNDLDPTAATMRSVLKTPYHNKSQSNSWRKAVTMMMFQERLRREDCARHPSRLQDIVATYVTAFEIKACLGVFNVSHDKILDSNSSYYKLASDDNIYARIDSAISHCLGLLGQNFAPSNFNSIKYDNITMLHNRFFLKLLYRPDITLNMPVKEAYDKILSLPGTAVVCHYCPYPTPKYDPNSRIVIMEGKAISREDYAKQRLAELTSKEIAQALAMSSFAPQKMRKYGTATIVRWEEPLRVRLVDEQDNDIDQNTNMTKQVINLLRTRSQDTGLLISITTREKKDNNVSIVFKNSQNLAGTSERKEIIVNGVKDSGTQPVSPAKINLQAIGTIEGVSMLKGEDRTLSAALNPYAGPSDGGWSGQQIGMRHPVSVYYSPTGIKSCMIVLSVDGFGSFYNSEENIWRLDPYVTECLGINTRVVHRYALNFETLTKFEEVLRENSTYFIKLLYGPEVRTGMLSSEFEAAIIRQANLQKENSKAIPP